MALFARGLVYGNPLIEIGIGLAADRRPSLAKETTTDPHRHDARPCGKPSFVARQP